MENLARGEKDLSTLLGDSYRLLSAQNWLNRVFLHDEIYMHADQ
jgi:hypothetical protein